MTLGLWLVDHWWRLRWEPIPDYRARSTDWRLSHELSSVSGGQLWPPLMIYGVGARVVLAPVASWASEVGPLRYLPPQAPAIVPGDDFERGVDQFLDQVLGYAAFAAEGHALQALRAQLERERDDTDTAAWRRLEAMLGYDADQAPDGLIEALAAHESGLGQAAVEEAAVAAPGVGAATALEQALAAARESKLVVNFGVADQVPPVRPQLAQSTPWRVAERAASHVRDVIGRPSGPLLNRALGDLLCVSETAVAEAQPTVGPAGYGSRLLVRGTESRLSLRKSPARDRRFSVARALGDAIWLRDAHFGPITRAKTDRQKFQRAFAQSLLCPFSDLAQTMDLDNPTEQEIDQAAKRYHVNRSVVRTLLVNKGYLPRETLEDKLEAA